MTLAMSCSVASTGRISLPVSSRNSSKAYRSNGSLVATVSALKYHGGVEVKETGKPDLAALERGIANIERHVANIRNHYGLPCVVSINHRTEDTDEEIQLLKDKMARHGAPVILARHWADGGKGAADVAREVVR